MYNKRESLLTHRNRGGRKATFLLTEGYVLCKNDYRTILQGHCITCFCTFSSVKKKVQSFREPNQHLAFNSIYTLLFVLLTWRKHLC